MRYRPFSNPSSTVRRKRCGSSRLTNVGPSAVGRRDERALEVRNDRGRSLVRPALQGHHYSLDVVLRHGRPSRRGAHLRPQGREPRPTGGGRRELLVLALQRSRLRSEIREDTPGDGLGRRLVDRGDVVPFGDHDLGKSARCAGRTALVGAGPGGDPGGEHECAERERGDERGTSRHGPRPPARVRDGESRAQGRHPYGPRELHEPSRGADERERREDRDLGRELRGLRCYQDRREEAHADCVRTASSRASRRRLGVGDHEEEEDEDLRRGHEQPPELPALDRPDVPGRRHGVAARSEHADTRPRMPARTRRLSPASAVAGG